MDEGEFQNEEPQKVDQQKNIRATSYQIEETRKVMHYKRNDQKTDILNLIAVVKSISYFMKSNYDTDQGSNKVINCL